MQRGFFFGSFSAFFILFPKKIVNLWAKNSYIDIVKFP